MPLALVASDGALETVQLADFDSRAGQSVAPSAQAVALAESLGASVTWNSFGTPRSLMRHGEFLAQGLTGDPVVAARSWIRANKELFGLSDEGVDSLELFNDAKLSGYDGRVLIFRQRFGDLPAGHNGLITVGIAGGNIAYVSSSSAGDQPAPGAPSLTPALAWSAAAADVGRSVSPIHVSASRKEEGKGEKGEKLTADPWTVFDVEGFSHPQRARLVAFPTPTDGVRPAFETIVLDVRDGVSTAYTHFVDAQTGEILFRQSLVHQLAKGLSFALAVTATPFMGSLPATDGGCGPMHGPYAVPANTFSIDVAATADLPANDIVLKLFFGTTLVQAADTATSPEAIHYEPFGGVPVGNYFVQVCEYQDGAGAIPPTSYTGAIVVNDAASTTPFPYPPKWKVFPANPRLGTLPADPWNYPSTDIRKVWCWDANINGNPVPGCDYEVGNLASRGPWDHDQTTDLPTYTTRGNNARTGEAWTSPLTPGAFGFQPVDTQRNYSFPWTNDWYARDCNPNNFVPGVGYDISAAVTNLFAMHNRMHDWSYFLGFTEENWNAQEDNFGLTPRTRQGDSLIGDAQAGAADGGFPSYLGRDNANMISLPDGVRPITNMYLWQPLAGAFYAPCVDGDYDMAIIGHEYAHLIENRMIGKGGTRTGHHAGAMGESNGDMNAVEYLNEYGFVPVSGENPFSVGAYATGNKQRAIRNYGMNYPYTGAFPTPNTSPHINPLNFSDLGYDITGGQVHADGEIWSAVNYDLRQALVAKFNAQYPASSAALQKKCADGLDTADHCPGNRRWIQLVYDAYLLMPVGPSMLDARNAYLAADVMRFGGANQSQIWNAFARRGFGQFAFSTNRLSNENDIDPRPDFESPLHTEANVRFVARASDEGNVLITKAKIYVGHYEARVSPIADTDPATNAPATSPASTNNLDDRAKFVAGTYEFVANAPGYGHVRFRAALTGGTTPTITIYMPTNWASLSKGATASGDGLNHPSLIDDDEGTNWDEPAGGLAINVQQPQVTVALAGPRQIDRAQVSAFLEAGQNRFTALRKFKIQTSQNGLTFTDWITSGDSAFPGAPPRPVAPEIILRTFSGPTRSNVRFVRIIALHNQCTGNPAFQGEQDADPLNDTDCRFGTPSSGLVPIFGDLPQVLRSRANEVHIAELQVFGRPGGTDAPPPPNDPVVVLTKTGPATASRGGTIVYTL
ncbi:MAG: M36 family metallopeptidase, partial [Thermoanaerobaculia bacterium]